MLKLAALIVVAAGAFFAWKQFAPPKEPSPTPATKAAPAKQAPVAAAPATPAAPLTPSETLNQMAHAPANAINKAQEAIEKRRASGQARIDAAVIGEDLPDQPAVAGNPAAVKGGSSPRPVTRPATTTVAPGVAATAAVEAAAEASAPFRSFVANAKVSGVFQGPPARAMINGRLTRVGEVVDGALGITFNGVDSPRRQLLFVDRSGATVSRRF